MNRERLLQFLYQTPVGIIEISADGSIGLMNAYATRYLLPLASDGRLSNLFDLLEPYLPDLRSDVEQYDRPSGTVVGHKLFSATIGNGNRVILSLSVERLDEELYMATLADTTEQVEQGERLQKARDDESEQRGRIEIASSVLHDIGNAVTGVSTSVSRLLSDEGWPEITELRRLEGLIESRREELSRVLGPERSRAMSSFLRELSAKLTERREELLGIFRSMAGTIGHISETLSVQRQYASEWVSGYRPRISLLQLLEDASAMQQTSLEKRGVTLSLPRNSTQVLIEGDRTKLVRVFVNILKNAAESFDPSGVCPDGPPAAQRSTERRITVAIDTIAEGRARVEIRDNGCGFVMENGADPTAEGQSGKAGSRGIGLYSAKRIVDGHGGRLEVRSPGAGKGTTVRVELPLSYAAPDRPAGQDGPVSRDADQEPPPNTEENSR